MPARIGSPGFRARMNTTRICCFGEAGNSAWRLRFSVAQPSAPVGCSGGIENWLNGTAVVWTSAPATERPLHAEMCTRSCRFVAVRGIGDGLADWPSICRTTGEVSCETLTGPVPDGQPFDVGLGAGVAVVVGAAFLTTAVGTDVADVA